MKLVPVKSGICEFWFSCGHNSCSLSIEEDLLCEAQIRPEKSDVRFFCLLSSVFCFLYSMPVENNRCFGVWPKHGYFNFFEGGPLCVEKWFSYKVLRKERCYSDVRDVR